MTTYGGESNTDEAILKRLNRGWKPQDRANVLLDRVEEYARLYKTTVKKLRIPVSLQGAAQQTVQDTGPRELQILEQVIQEGEEADKIGAYEALVIHQIRNGTRDYIDDALDEVGHVSAVPKSGQLKSFNWRDAGHHTQLPGLRRSMHANSVTDSADMGQIMADDDEGSYEDTGASDFNANFASSKVRWNNAAAVKAGRKDKSRSAWGSRVKAKGIDGTKSASNLAGLSAAAADSGKNLVNVNAPRCSTGCKNCYEKVEAIVKERKKTEAPYDNWVREQRLANKQARDLKNLLASNTRATGFGATGRSHSFSPESSIFGSSPRATDPFFTLNSWAGEERFGTV